MAVFLPSMLDCFESRFVGSYDNPICLAAQASCVHPGWLESAVHCTYETDISQQNVKRISLLIICFSSSNTYPHLFIGLFGFGRSRLVDRILIAQSFRRVRHCPSFDSGSRAMLLPSQSETRTCARLKNVDKRSPSSTRVSQTTPTNSCGVIGTRGEYGVLVRTFDLFDNGHVVYKEALTKYVSIDTEMPTLHSIRASHEIFPRTQDNAFTLLVGTKYKKNWAMKDFQVNGTVDCQTYYPTDAGTTTRGVLEDPNATFCRPKDSVAVCVNGTCLADSDSACSGCKLP